MFAPIFHICLNAEDVEKFNNEFRSCSIQRDVILVMYLQFMLRTVFVADRVTEETERKELEMQRKKAISEETKKDEEEHQKTRQRLPGKQQPSSNELQSIFSKWKEQQEQQQQQQHTGDAV